jgi:hypothetical protein
MAGAGPIPIICSEAAPDDAPRPPACPGFGFDSWASQHGLSPGFSYQRIEDAHRTRKFEIRSHTNSFAPMIAYNTLEEFAAALGL